MFTTLIPPNTNIDFMGKAPFFMRLTIGSIIVSLILIVFPGMKFGLDFSGGYEVLIAFDKPVTSEDVRTQIEGLSLGDTSVQSYSVPDSPKTFFLVRVQRAEALSAKDLEEVNAALASRYGDVFKGPVGYDPEIGHAVDVELVRTGTASGVDTGTVAVVQVFESSNHSVSRIQSVGRPDELRYSVVLRGVDVKMVDQLQKTIDPSAAAMRTDFVGPTVGKQLRDDGILAMFYAVLIILVYIAFRFDFFYAPGAVLNVFQAAVLAVGFMVVVRREMNLATVAGLLTLIGYVLNDTIIVYDRIREVVGKAQGTALNDVLNRAVNEMLGRTIMTSSVTFAACACLMIFGAGTVLFDFGLIMGFGVIIGTYSSIYVAAPVFKYMRERYGVQEETKEAPGGASART